MFFDDLRTKIRRRLQSSNLIVAFDELKAFSTAKIYKQKVRLSLVSQDRRFS